MQKAGMTREGVARQHVKKWGSYEDLVLYGMLRGDPRRAGSGRSEGCRGIDPTEGLTVE